VAGPSVAVRILGDLSAWAKSISGASETANTGAGKIKNAFSGVLGILNKSGVLGPFTGALDGVSEALDSISKKSADVGEKLLGAGGAIVGVGAGLMAFGSAQKEAQQQLSTAIDDTGASYSTYAGQIAEAVKAEEKHGETANETMNALQKLTEVTHSPATALQDLSVASDLAAAKHEDLTTAAGQLGKAFNGNMKVLKDFGITTKTSGSDAVSQLASVVKGQGDAAADSFSGKLRDLKATVEDDVATFANKWGPAITAVGAGLSGIGATMEVVSGVTDLLKNSTLLATVATQAQTAAQWLLNTAMSANPIGVVVVLIAALVAAFVLAYQHITVFRDGVNDLWHAMAVAFDGIKVAAVAVFDWLKSNWPLLLGVLTGPFGLMLAIVVTHWNSVKSFLEGIPGDIRSIFSGASHWLEQAGEDVVHGLVNGIKSAAAGAVNDVKAIPGQIVGGFKSALGIHSPSTVFAEFGRNTIEGYVQGIKQSAGTAASAVSSAVDALVPTAPPGPAMAVAGAAGAYGAAMHVENMNVSSAVDVDLLAQKVGARFAAARV
jgi:phage-related protein